ncbi:hypothetical protein [Scrofimicrobium canadense]|nr:hypothetical protein [Scrofimicrobium canadense]
MSDPSRFDGVKTIGVDDSPARFAYYGRCPQLLETHRLAIRQVRHRDH